MWLGVVLAGGAILVFLGGLVFLPGEYRFGTQVTVSRSPERAWMWFVKPERWSRRFPMVQTLDVGSEATTGIGARRRVIVHAPGGQTLVCDILVTDFTEGRLYADRHLGDWLDGRPLPVEHVTDRVEFDPDGPGKTRITFKSIFDVEGPLNKWLAYFELKPAADRIIARVLKEYDRSVLKAHPVPTTRG